MWVVKLGGSLWDKAELHQWLRALARAAPVARVVVPGGGPFADTVRRAQPVMGLSDRAAHQMAILAMEQYGRALLDVASLARGVETLGAAHDLARERALGVWLPARMALHEPELKASWDVSSDSIALWLAARLEASELILVKSCSMPKGKLYLSELADQGLVDPFFPDYARSFRGTIHIVSRFSHGLVGDVGAQLPGVVLKAERNG
jgi:5-(aminomethyl)-3-furanmethanol phosphate kinase